MFGDHSRLSLTCYLTPHTERPEPRFRKHTHTHYEQKDSPSVPDRVAAASTGEECPTIALASFAKLYPLDDIRDPCPVPRPSISERPLPSSSLPSPLVVQPPLLFRAVLPFVPGFCRFFRGFSRRRCCCCYSAAVFATDLTRSERSSDPYPELLSQLRFPRR